MNYPDIVLTAVATALYFAGLVVVGFEIAFRKEGLGRVWQAIVACGLGVEAGALIARTAASGEVPLTDLFEYNLVFTWAIVFVFFVLFRNRLPRLASLTLLVVVVFLLGTSFLYYTDPKGVSMPALRSYWLYIHVSLAALGETFFAIGFVSSIIYLVKSAKPDDVLDHLTYRAISLGFPLFTAGALVAGAIWAKKAWGAYWSWDPKEVLSLVVWLVYAAYLHARLVRGLRGKVLAVISIAGFLLTIFTIFGTLIFGGLHSYS